MPSLSVLFEFVLSSIKHFIKILFIYMEGISHKHYHTILLCFLYSYASCPSEYIIMFKFLLLNASINDVLLIS